MYFVSGAALAWALRNFLCSKVVRTGWVMEQTIQAHLNRVRDHLLNGRNVLRSLHESDLKPYDVPDVTVDLSVLHRQLPEDNDKFVDVMYFPPLFNDSHTRCPGST